MSAGGKPWFFRKVLSERQTLFFLITVWFVATLHSCVVNLPGPDYRFTDDKGTYVTYLRLLGYQMELASFRDGLFWCWLGLQILAVFVAVKLRTRIGLILAVVAPLLWVFLVVGQFTPGQG
jgi:hypothetical protein